MPSLPRLVVAVTLGCALMLTGCTQGDHVLTPVNTPPTGEGTFDPGSDPVNESVGINCRELVSDQVVYDWGNGNFSLSVDYEPTAGSAAAQVVAEGGLACSWVNLTSSETVDIAVASASSDDLATAASTAAAAGEPAPVISDNAYFDGGHVDVFTDRYWITADSTWFGSADDAAPLLTAAIAALG